MGREPILTRLVETASPDADKDDCQRSIIEGLGGVGKTQIAPEFAYRIRNSHQQCSIFWVPAVDVAGFENAYRDIAQSLQLKSAEDDSESLMLLVKNALSREDWGRWLLIIDNADDLDITLGVKGLFNYLPFSRKGSILFTTRNPEISLKLDLPPENKLVLSGMIRNEAFELLRKSLKESQISDKPSTDELLAILADLPLAIKQASKYMTRTRMTTTKYLAYCHSSPQTFIRLLSEDFEDRHRYGVDQNPVATTWFISFSHIVKEKPLAAMYLRFMSLLSARGIPSCLLPPAETELDAEEAIGTLKGYGFIEERENSLSLDIHRLIRLAAQNWMRVEDILEACVSDVFQRLATAFPSPNHQNRDVWMKYLPHAHAALEFRRNTKEARSLAIIYSKVAESNEILGKYDTAGEMYKEKLVLMHSILGQEHPDTIASMGDFARTLRRQGKLSDAEEMQRKAFELSQTVFGPGDPITLRIMGDFATTLQRRGGYKEAEQIHRQTISLRKTALGPDHPDLLESLKNVAYNMRKQRKYDGAEQLQRHVLASSERLFGLQHPETLQNMNNLATTLWSQGQFGEAEYLYCKTIALQGEVLGHDHPKTLKSKSNLARTLTSLGKYEMAEKIHREVLGAMEVILGRTHPDTLSSMIKLAEALWKQMKFSEAEELHRKALGLYEQALGREHPDTIKALDALTLAFNIQGRYGEAEQLRSELM